MSKYSVKSYSIFGRLKRFLEGLTELSKELFCDEEDGNPFVHLPNSRFREVDKDQCPPEQEYCTHEGCLHPENCESVYCDIIDRKE